MTSVSRLVYMSHPKRGEYVGLIQAPRSPIDGAFGEGRAARSPKAQEARQRRVCVGHWLIAMCPDG